MQKFWNHSLLMHFRFYSEGLTQLWQKVLCDFTHNDLLNYDQNLMWFHLYSLTQLWAEKLSRNELTQLQIKLLSKGYSSLTDKQEDIAYSAMKIKESS